MFDEFVGFMWLMCYDILVILRNMNVWGLVGYVLVILYGNYVLIRFNLKVFKLWKVFGLVGWEIGRFICKESWGLFLDMCIKFFWFIWKSSLILKDLVFLLNKFFIRD